MVRAKRRLEIEELDILRVLDERGRIDPTVGDQGESPRTMRDKLETARALESLPEIAAAAYEGDLSAEQLSAVTKLADEESMRSGRGGRRRWRRWSWRGWHATWSKPSTEDSRPRYEARSVRMWWTPDKGMLHLHGQLPDVMGATFEATIQQLTEQMKPAKGQALGQLRASGRRRAGQHCVTARGSDETADVGARAGVADADPPVGTGGDRRGADRRTRCLEQLRANATIEPVLVDDDGTPIVIGKRFPALSPKIVRAVLLRDERCRL